MKTLFYLFFTTTLLAQPWSPDGICDFTDGGQWNNGGSTGCACTWLSFNADWDTIINCAFGDCGQNALMECAYDCNGHNGYATDNIARQCDATADPICWFNGNGSQGEAFCLGLIALPIIFLEAEGYHTNGRNIIKWSTASEYNSSHYIISRSDGASDFEHMATIPANGDTSNESAYRAIDLSPLEGPNYYKITQYDYDGASSDLTVLYIDNSKKELMKEVNTLGQDVDETYKGLVIRLFSDGSSQMIMR